MQLIEVSVVYFASIYLMLSTEPISRRLMRFGKTYQNLLNKQVGQLGLERYYDVLTVIYLHKGTLTQKALGELLDKDKSALVSIIDLLTDKGYVFREINPADRREQLLKTTAKAERDVPEILKAVEAVNKSSAENIDDAEMDTFNKVLKMMEANLNAVKFDDELSKAQPKTMQLI